ncbi:C4-dicarboxylate ABC transporter permease [candidate division KSB3 bacterium]|uniref:C4-dicarboxylate ABC transporter permease n=1 Tax=candidate division KSB3 bacterium TaxID=2044937 RepID=A0A9D5Q7Z0_9BACT|nr:C4-dicarboxylate ABC transporter permease [candidate division KSB3 bacterium]MBD3326802.1 C4-dicarboxylate ABC transporter permease [candidate division KSB3 bacterium]
MSSVIQGFLYVLHPWHFPFLFIGVAGGIIVGALPGLTGSVGIILLLPFVYYLDVSTAMVMLCGMFCGAIYGGSISAILISTPGTPSAAATVLDGYPLAQKGEAGRAIGVATIASTTGGIISTFCLMFIAPQLARFALKFGPEEYFALTVFGLTVIASVAGKSLIKGLISGFFGLLIATIGLDPVTGYARFSFNIPNLMTGFPLLPVLIGLFAISQIFIQLEDVGKQIVQYDQNIRGVLPSWKELKKLATVIIPSAFLGTFIGVIPGTGGAIASFLAYNEARRWSKDPDSFGKGNVIGIAAPEAANNGTTGGAMVPLLTLGIPGDVVTAVMLGALLLIGLRPGPLLFKDRPEVVSAIFAGLLLANVLILLLGILSVRLFPKVLKVPSQILFPVILTLCFLGSFSLNNSVYDMLIALIFGIIGYMMRKNGFPAAPVVLGVILGPIAEDVLARALLISRGDWTVLFKSPIALFFYGISILSLIYSIRRQLASARRDQNA